MQGKTSSTNSGSADTAITKDCPCKKTEGCTRECPIGKKHRVSSVKPGMWTWVLACIAVPTFASDVAMTASQESSPLTSIKESNELTQYFDSVHEGPGVWKWRHYFQIYEKHFRRFVGTDVHIAEIGIYSGGSLRMWRKYFGEKAHIYGIDIAPETLIYQNNSAYGRPDRIFVGDQSSSALWDRIKAETPRIDILIDDGGHMPSLQNASLRLAFSHLSPGAVYLCEDISVGSYGAGFVQMIFDEFVLGSGGIMVPAVRNSHNHGGDDYRAMQLSSVQRFVPEITFYPFVVVIQKSRLIDGSYYLHSQRHGSLWKPMHQFGMSCFPGKAKCGT